MYSYQNLFNKTFKNFKYNRYMVIKNHNFEYEVLDELDSIYFLDTNNKI